ncbi:hypothetical protein SAMN02927916_2698 [Flavobacterium anhuiense]|uniref:Uncharacterized protein n=1 Tax=Flavobacterium anhuiense TaxID=459526 RepID=A0ABY0LTF0_9FLAO|nr:hypothetical protein [Flavobacterium anhuiense]SCY63487.1 hypothetical protein SAMN02927916_2698 [Flavobacterium anhuiense]
MKTQNTIKPAKKCYSHIGGKLGELLFETSQTKNGSPKMRLQTNTFTSLNWEKKNLLNWA